MGIFAWIVLGGLAGWVASIIMSKNSSMGILANIVVGIIGAFIGGFIMKFLGYDGITGWNWPSFFIALLGAVILLGLINLLSRKR